MNVRTGDPCFISAAALAETSLPEVQKEIIGDGQIAIIAAQYGRGKTPLFAHLALEGACAVPLTPLGLDSCRGPVMVFDGESNPSSYKEMLARIMRGVEIERWPENLQLWFRLDPSLTPGHASFDSLTRVVAQHQPGLLVLDPLRQFCSGYDLTKPKEAVLFINILRSLQAEAPKLRIGLPHHLTKRDLNTECGALADDPWAWLERVSGSLALLDHADVRLGFEEENGKLVLAGIKRGVGTSWPVALHRGRRRKGATLPISLRRQGAQYPGTLQTLSGKAALRKSHLENRQTPTGNQRQHDAPFRQGCKVSRNARSRGRCRVP